MVVLAYAFLLALLAGSLVEYAVHRMMHKRWLLGRRHTEHHRKGIGQGVLGEFRDYLLAVPILGPLGLLHSAQAAVAFASGLTFYAAVAAYSHQVNHERPELVFWAPRPVHHLHHRHNEWFHNFGITLDVWDRVFGTYQRREWAPERRPFQHPARTFWQIKWH